MNKEKVNSIICKIEFLLGSLREEIGSESNPLLGYEYEEIVPSIDDYDEVFYEDEE